jgi:hypothetical protein
MRLDALVNEPPFDWELFDVQPVPVKRVTWEHNVYPDRLVHEWEARQVARLMAKGREPPVVRRWRVY